MNAGNRQTQQFSGLRLVCSGLTVSGLQVELKVSGLRMVYLMFRDLEFRDLEFRDLELNSKSRDFGCFGTYSLLNVSGLR